MDDILARALVGLAFSASLVAGAAAADAAIDDRVVGDAIPEPLVANPGDPARGRAIVADRRKGLCLLCHSGPFPEERFQGDLAPSLSGAGDRLDVGRLRLRIVDSRRVNPDTIMPAFHATSGRSRVAQEFSEKPILDAQEIEDVVAYLATLKAGKDAPR